MKETMYDVTELIKEYRHPNELVKYINKMRFVDKVIKQYVARRFSIKMRTVGRSRINSTLTVEIAAIMMRTITVTNKEDPTRTVRAAVSSLLANLELFFNNPRPKFLSHHNASKASYSPIDLESAHSVVGGLYIAPKKRRNVDDSYKLMVMGNPTYHLLLREVLEGK